MRQVARSQNALQVPRVHDLDQDVFRMLPVAVPTATSAYNSDLYTVAVLAQQRALAADRAAAEMLQRRLALEEHNLGYAWSLAHLQQNLQAANLLAYNQHPVVVGPDSTRWSGVPALPARQDPLTLYNPASVVPEGWGF